MAGRAARFQDLSKVAQKEAAGCDRRLPRHHQQLGVQRSRERGLPGGARERHAGGDGCRIRPDAGVAEHGRHRDRDGERVRCHRSERRAPVPRLPHRRAREATACRQDQGAGHRRRRDRVVAVRVGSLPLYRSHRGGHGRQRRPARHGVAASVHHHAVPEGAAPSYPRTHAFRARVATVRVLAPRAEKWGSRRPPRGRAAPKTWASTRCGCPITSSTRCRDTGAIRPHPGDRADDGARGARGNTSRVRLGTLVLCAPFVTPRS